MDFDMHSNLYNSAVCWYISRYFFFSLPLCVYHPPLIFNEVLKRGRKKREYLSCFYLFICGTLYIDWKSHLLCIIRGHPILLSHNENWFNSPQLLCVKLDREIERDRRKKVCNQFLLSIFVWKIQCDRWRWLHRVWKQKQLSPWVSQWTPSTLILRKR